LTRILILDIAKPDDLEWLNSNDRLSHWTEAKLKKRWRRLGFEAVLDTLDCHGHWATYGTVPNAFTRRVLVTAHIWKPISNRYDPNNLWATTKPLMDGIVDSGLFADDDWKHVRGPHHEHGGKGRPRVVLTIEEER
jgi:hypothetical protein